MNLDFVPLSECHQEIHVGRTGRAGEGRRLIQDKLFESSRSAHHKHPDGLFADGLEPVRDFARAIYKRAGSSFQPLAATQECYFPLEDIEALVLAVMGVVRRGKSYGHIPVFDQGEGPIGGFAGRPGERRKAQEPVASNLSRVQEGLMHRAHYTVGQASGDRMAGMSTFVLVHGAWQSAATWNLLTPLLQEQGHTVIAPVLSGLGTAQADLSPSVSL